MTDKDKDDIEIFEARKALAEAEFAETQVNAVVGSATRNSREVRTIVERNGYVERFRHLLRGA
jgi:autonomous glycyl radical cofactor GrcA